MQVFTCILLGFLLVCAISVSLSKNLLNSILIFMSYSLVMSVIWILLESPDLAITEAAVGAVAFLIVELMPKQLIGIFGAANESIYYTEFAIKAFRIYLCMIILACVNKATFIYLQAMGNALVSTMLSMVREIIFGVGFALILPVFFGLDGVLYSMPVSDILTFVISLIVIIYTYRTLKTTK